MKPESPGRRMFPGLLLVGGGPSPASAPVSSYRVYSGSDYEFSYLRGTAADGSGNVWVVNYDGNSVTELQGVATPLPFKLPKGQ